jgi:hypothetical protein
MNFRITDYKTVKETAKEWGVSERRVLSVIQAVGFTE